MNLALFKLGIANLKELFSTGLGVVMMIGFFIGVVLIMSGAWQIKQGNADSGKLNIIGGIIIAASVSIMAFFYGAGDMDGGIIEPTF